jgi:2-C-methyl-D-erythritol 4-phosphate cytidylyltransferase
MSVAVLVLAAGRGERLGQGQPKAFVEVAGLTLLERSIRAMARSGAVDRIQPVLASQDFERYKVLALQDVPGLVPPVAGGAERQDSMRAGLESLPEDCEWVAVHDAARCLVAPADVRRVVEAARADGAAILAEPVRDTIKLVSAGQIVETPARETCWAAQTPQVAARELLRSGLEAAMRQGRQATDDAQLVEWLGRKVTVVRSQATNPKITLPTDLALAEALLGDASSEEPGEKSGEPGATSSRLAGEGSE